MVLYHFFLWRQKSMHDLWLEPETEIKNDIFGDEARRSFNALPLFGFARLSLSLCVSSRESFRKSVHEYDVWRMMSVMR